MVSWDIKMPCETSACEDAIAALAANLRIRELLQGGSISCSTSSRSNSSKNASSTPPSRTDAMRVTCRPCSSEGPEGGARAVLMDSSPLEIVLCTNRLSVKEIEDVVVHELVHVYDHTNKRCDLSTCEGLAYSEVRAAREAECNRFFPFLWLKTECVRHHATRSTANLFPADAAKCVAASMDKAMADDEPFSHRGRSWKK